MRVCWFNPALSLSAGGVLIRRRETMRHKRLMTLAAIAFNILCFLSQPAFSESGNPSRTTGQAAKLEEVIMDCAARAATQSQRRMVYHQAHNNNQVETVRDHKLKL
jgi:hypothetical protein